MGTETSCCAPSKQPLNLTEQMTSNRFYRQKKDPFESLEGYIPVDGSEQEGTATYQNSLMSSEFVDQNGRAVTGIP